MTIQSASTRRPRRVRASVAGAVVGLLALTACTSDPGPRRVAHDIIQAEAVLNPELDEECLLEELNKFSDDELKRIAEQLESDPATQETAQAALDEFGLALDACN